MAGFLGVLALDPGSTLALRNTRFLTNRILTIVSALVFWTNFIVGSTFISGQSRIEGGATGMSPDRFLPVLSALIAIAVVGLYLELVRRRSAGSFGRLARALPHVDRFLTTWAAAIGLAILSLVVAAFTPDEVSADIFRALIFWLAGFYFVSWCVALYRRWT